MVNRKRLVFVIVGLVIVIVGYNLFAAYMEEKKEEHVAELIQIAQNVEIGEGVTLQQGARALFGTSPNWGSLDHNKGWIYMKVSNGDTIFTAQIHVNETTRQASFGECHFKIGSEDYNLDSNGVVNIVFKRMIEAAKG